MSNYIAPAYHPEEKVIRAAFWIDDYFGRHRYGVLFDDDGRVFRPEEVAFPAETVFVPRGDEYKRGLDRAAEIADVCEKLLEWASWATEGDYERDETPFDEVEAAIAAIRAEKDK